MKRESIYLEEFRIETIIRCFDVVKSAVSFIFMVEPFHRDLLRSRDDFEEGNSRLIPTAGESFGLLEGNNFVFSIERNDDKTKLHEL